MSRSRSDFHLSRSLNKLRNILSDTARKLRTSGEWNVKWEKKFNWMPLALA
jgi:hypothetical protein